MTKTLDRWMPLHIADYRKDTVFLTTLQHGAYMLLLMASWEIGPLDDNETFLSSIAKVDLKTWRKDVWPAIKRFFSKADDGQIFQKRLSAERDKAERISEIRRKNGREGGSKPKAKGKANASSNAKPNAVANAEAPSRDSLQSSSLHSEEHKSSLRSDVGCNAPDAPPEKPMEDRWQELGEEVIAAAGTDPSRSMVQTGGVRQWLADAKAIGYGYDGAREIILGTVREKAKYGGRGKPPAWFDKPVSDAIRTGTISASGIQREAVQKLKSRQQLAAETWANVPDIEGV